MSDSTIVLITGVARGIGKGLAEAYLARPNHTVIGTFRDTTSPTLDALHSHSKAPGSRLILVQLESTRPEDYTKLASTIKSEGITRLDIVIPNAGVASPAGSPATVDIQALTNVFEVNTLSTVRLFQATREFLEKSPGKPKWASMSSAAALVQTEMGNKGAQMMGLKEAPNTIEEAVTKTMATIDGATREGTSGKFLNIIDGTEVPW
ncbi:hypothetical protein ASPSYDRAFT_161681 [Aspergillus sydowii CBS 593.65]|uniref:Ketoreductase (KR) domain-containing protein n=1 Tax=Aspergillus sydowii CBS 593.65 TaxID=1036612 RepID=A0A1L9T2S9_9EURO|nr:uncharacterized protein ASPSYDRAFT_161681 [Aspergillus sydowii CBS 593.65]OJJ53752.1 hypothetical protein ASPSYDRAFT_161681 [Aspergillus sydowii CBS 593.65]